MPQMEWFRCATVEAWSALGVSLGRRNFWELDGLSFLGRIALGLRFLGHITGGIIVCRCLYTSRHCFCVAWHACLLSFSLLVFPTRGLVAWFPRNQVFCHGSPWTWIWQPYGRSKPDQVAGCPSGDTGPRHRLHTAGWVWPQGRR